MTMTPFHNKLEGAKMDANISQDCRHRLADELLKKYEDQIEYLNSFGDSGINLFQRCREAQILAVGSGSFLVSLAGVLFKSGMSKFHVCITDSVPANRQRLQELAENARRSDPEASVEEITLAKKGISSWREAIQPFSWILYVSEEGNIEELRALHVACRAEKKPFLPAMCMQHVGLAGPLEQPDAEACWESAWRRLHLSTLRNNAVVQDFSPAAGAMLANVMVFELLKSVTGVTESGLKQAFFLLDLQTLEGGFHSFLLHPLVTGHFIPEQVHDVKLRIGQNPGNREPNGLFSYFSRLTSPETGIFHLWDEGDLKQLPLPQGRVQAADPLSEGPAELLPIIIRTGLTHKEARREAGLAGIEAYVWRMADFCMTKLDSNQDLENRIAKPNAFMGIGAGETFEEAVIRGLQKCLTEEFKKQSSERRPAVVSVQLSSVEDVHCHFYLQALTTMERAPVIGSGEEFLGFPVMWVGTSDCWYGCVGLNKTMALRMALQDALIQTPNNSACLSARGLKIPSLEPEDTVTLNLTDEQMEQTELLQCALQVLEQNRKRLLIFDMMLEAFLKEEPGGVFGVLLQEEESR